DDVADAKGRVGDDFAAEDLRRTGTQRRADAMVDMAKRSALVSDTAPLGRPLITIVCGDDAFADLCELAADRTPVTVDQVVPHLTEADIERVVFGADRRVIEVGERERFFTGALRRAIEVRDRQCTHESGCDVTAEHAQIDHIIPYAEGGLTTQTNGR